MTAGRPNAGRQGQAPGAAAEMRSLERPRWNRKGRTGLGPVLAAAARVGRGAALERLTQLQRWQQRQNPSRSLAVLGHVPARRTGWPAPMTNMVAPPCSS